MARTENSMWARHAVGAIAISWLSGCQLLPSDNDVPEGMMGMPAAPLSEIENMFEQPDYLDGAPRDVIYKGDVVGLWLPMRATDHGCIAYSMALDSDSLEAPDMEFFWHGERYRNTEEGCVPIAEVVHSDPADDEGNRDADLDATALGESSSTLEGWPVGWAAGGR